MHLRFLLCCLALACGCKPSDCKIEGQVFIRQRNGETLKLSLVPIALYTTNAFQQHIANNSILLKQALAPLNSQMDHAREAQSKAYDQMQPWVNRKQEIAAIVESKEREIKSHADEFRRKAVNWNSEQRKKYSDTVQKLNDDRAAAKARLAEVAEKITQIEREVATLSREIESRRADKAKLERAHSLFNRPWPQPTAATTTDKDGSFTLTIPKDSKYVIVAEASREILDKKEEYKWAAPCGCGPVHLNNVNLLNSTDFED